MWAMAFYVILYFLVFIYLAVVAHRIFDLHGGMWDLQLWYAGEFFFCGDKMVWNQTVVMADKYVNIITNY